ncbi:hypothetical protein D3C76_1748650 [compost metagenome]
MHQKDLERVQVVSRWQLQKAVQIFSVYDFSESLRKTIVDVSEPVFFESGTYVFRVDVFKVRVCGINDFFGVA